MSDENVQENTLHEATNILQSRPQRRSKRGPAMLLLLLGGVLIIGVIAVVAWQALLPHTPSTGQSATRGSTAASKRENSGVTPPGWNDPAIYWQTIREQVAQGFHLSVAQITAKLHAAGAASTVTPSATNKGSSPDPGASMAAVAAQQGISTDQLRTIELHALQKACDVLVVQGRLTQTGADQRMQTFRGWDQGTMNWYVMHAFTGQ
jgi:hypothetical protein